MLDAIFGRKGMILILLLTVQLIYSQETIPSSYKDTFFFDEHHDSLDPVYFYVTELPVIPGGMMALKEYIKNYPYPQCRLNSNIQGKVVIQFIVERNGSISALEVLKGPDSCLTDAALAYIQQIPKWIPGKRDGKEVACLFSLPIQYDLNEFRRRRKE